jgi:hypothetical protein
MSERAARGQLAEQQEQLASLEASVAKLKGKLQSRSDDLATQRAVNQQLMLKKEEVEWQLLAAIAQVINLEQGEGRGVPCGDYHWTELFTLVELSRVRVRHLSTESCSKFLDKSTLRLLC